MSDAVDMSVQEPEQLESDAPALQIPDVAPESIIEALLFSTDVPLSAGRLSQLAGIGDTTQVKNLIESMNAHYEASGSAFRIQSVAKGFQMLTLPTYNHWLQKLHKARAESRLSPAALETLAVIAYKQPVLRAEIETIRGVAAGDMLVRLRDMNLVRITGRAEEIGRPLLYGTTNRFLEIFGLESLKDLPKTEREDQKSFPPLKPVSNE